MRTPLVVLVFNTILCVACAQSNGAEDVQFLSQHTFYDVRSAGMAGAGCAVPGNLATAYLNPALPRVFAQERGVKAALATFGYGRDPVFSGHVIPAGAGFTHPEIGTMGILCRYLQADEEQEQYEAMAFYSGKLFDKNLDQGAVNFGFNLRYERMAWETAGYDNLYSLTYPWRNGGIVQDSGIVFDSSFIDGGRNRHHRLLFDVGLFQAGISDKLDFGVTLYNALGYIWTKEKPSVVQDVVYDADTSSIILTDGTIVPKYDTTAVSYFAEYENRYQESNGWVSQWDRRLSIAIAFRQELLDDRLVLVIPLDVEIAGLFDRSRDNHYMLRTGVEAGIKGSYFLRFGYARDPVLVRRGEAMPENSNVFTGGIGIKTSHFAADFFFGNEMWGLGISFAY